MTAGTEPRFHLVRRGYDVEQVDDFVRTQASASAEALEAANCRAAAHEQKARTIHREAQTRIEQLEAHIGHLTQEASKRVTGLQRQIAELEGVQAEIDQVHLQQAALTAALQTATTTRDELIEAAEVAIASQHNAAQSEARAIRERATADAEELVASAKAAAANATRRANAEIESAQRDCNATIRTQRADAKDAVRAMLDEPRQQAKELNRQVGLLTVQRNQLVRSLEAIATAGLQAHYGIEQDHDDNGGSGPRALGENDILDLSDSITIAGG